MAWTFRAIGGQHATNNSTALFSGGTDWYPTGWAAGDLLVMVIGNNGVASADARQPVTPAGWTAVTGLPAGNTGRAGQFFGVYWRIAQAGDDTGPDVTMSGTGVANDSQVGRIAGWSSDVGVDGISVIGAATENASQNAVGAITGITPAAGELVLVIGAKSNIWNGSPTCTDFTKRMQSTNVLVGTNLFEVASWGGGATGTKTITDSGTPGFGIGIVISFAESAAAGLSIPIAMHHYRSYRG